MVGKSEELKLSKYRKLKIISLLIYVLIACIVVYFTKPIYLLSIIIVLFPPTIANFIWLKKSRKKIFIFSIITTALFAVAVELSCRLACAWDVQSVLPRIFGIAPIENLIFAFINFFWVLTFYECFVDKYSTRTFPSKFKYLVGLFLVFSIAIFSLFFYKKEIIALSYFKIGVIILLIPSIFLFYNNPRLLKKTILPTIFFAVVFFVYEFVALMIGNWWWPGNYLLPVNLFGHVFPLDDVIIWYFLSTITLIGGYEFFADDFE